MTYCADLDQAERFIRLVYPDLEGQPLDRSHQGNEYFTFISSDEVIRVARNEIVAQNMQREVALQSEICAKPFSASIPQVTDFQPDNNIMRIQKIAGKPVSEIISTLSPEEQQQVAEKTGLFLAELHSFFPRSDAHDAMDFVADRDLLLSRAEKIKAATTDLAELARLEKISAYISDYKSVDDRQVMIHGDISPGNIIYDHTTKQIGFLDFNNCKTGFAHRDFSVMAHLFPADFVCTAMESYAEKIQRPMSVETVKAGADTLSLLHGYRDEGVTFKPAFQL